MKEFKSALKKFLPKIREAKEKSLNEADTRMRIRILLSDVLGYDLLEDITQEHMVQSHYVDLTVKAQLWDKKTGKYKQKIIFFIEVKSVDTTLRDTHAYQAKNYAATGGVNLCLLTNGIDYKLYHLTWAKEKVESSLVMSFNILDDDFNKVAEYLWLLSKQSFKKGLINKYIAEATSLEDKNLLIAMLSERVIRALRLELKSVTGHNVKDEAIEKKIKELFSEELFDMVKSSLKKTQKKKSQEITQPTVNEIPKP